MQCLKHLLYTNTKKESRKRMAPTKIYISDAINFHPIPRTTCEAGFFNYQSKNILLFYYCLLWKTIATSSRTGRLSCCFRELTVHASLCLLFSDIFRGIRFGFFITSVHWNGQTEISRQDFQHLHFDFHKLVTSTNADIFTNKLPIFPIH